jgi:hypothetical protein
MSTKLLSQKEVLAAWPVLSDANLNEARRLGQIEWVRGKYKAPYYTEEAVEAYISTYRTHRCGTQKVTASARTPKLVAIPSDLREKALARIAGGI